ncbi:hypothetical protein HQ520_12920 [bacterium]|nr:hypothetical protein [bacterium]
MIPSILRKYLVWMLPAALLALGTDLCSADLPPFEADGPGRIDSFEILGPFPAGSIAATSPTLQANGSIETGEMVWDQGRPYAWTSASAKASVRLSSGWIDVRDVFGPGKMAEAGGPGAFVLAWRRIRSAERKQALLSCGATGAVKVWWNGERLVSVGWTPPGQDCALFLVTLEAGINHLLIRSETPPEGTPWRVGGSLSDRDSFAGLGIEYPRWHFSSPPPWKQSPAWVRWGDPFVEQYLGVKGRLAEIRARSGSGKATSQGVEVGAALPDGVLAPGMWTLEATLGNGGRPDSWTMLVGPAEQVVLRTPKGPVAAGKIGGPGSWQRRLLSELTQAAGAARPASSFELIVLQDSLEAAAVQPNPSRTTSWPEGWLRLYAGEGKDVPAYLARLPEGGEGQQRPVLVVVPPRGEDGWSLGCRSDELAAAAQAKGWLLLAIDGSNGAVFEAKGSLRLVLEDAIQRLPCDPRRVSVMFQETPATGAVQAALSLSRPIAGLFLMKPTEGRPDEWEDLLARNPRLGRLVVSSDAAGRESKRPEGLFLDSSGNGLEKTLDFLGGYALQLQPRRIAFVADYPDEARVAWLSVLAAREWSDVVRVEAEIIGDEEVQITCQNVVLLYLDLAGTGHLRRKGALTIRVNGERRMIVDAELPPAVILRLTPHGESQRWFVEIADPEPPPVEPIPMAQSEVSLSPWSAGGQGGVNQVLAQAVRAATGAVVAVLPADSAWQGHAAGPVYLRDLANWCDDSRLSTLSVPTALLRRTLEADYAGPRSLVTDGLNAALDNGIPAVDLPGESSGTGNRDVIFFGSSRLDQARGEIVIAGRADLLERPETWLNIDPASSLERVALGRMQAFDADLTLRYCLLFYFDQIPLLEEVAADIRLLPHKSAGQEPKERRAGP